MKSTLILALAAILNLSVNAQSTGTSETEAAVSTGELKNLTLEIGFNATSDLSSTEAEDDDDEVSGKGINIGFGKIVNLPNFLVSTTSLRVNYNNLDVENAPLDVRTYDIGIEQRISYRLPSQGNLTLMPFIEAGIARGNFNSKVAFNDGTDLIDIDLDNSYTRIGGAVGLTAEYNRVTPFVKYSFSRLNLDSEAEGTIRVNGLQTEVATFSSDDDINANVQTLTVGLGFLF